MRCKPSNLPPGEEVDIPVIAAKYAEERGRRLQSDGGHKFVRPIGVFESQYAADPHTPLIQREPISENIDVIILGAGFSGILTACHLTEAGVSNFRNVDLAGDFGGVWYWNRYPGIQCDNDAYCYLPLLEESAFMPAKKFSDGDEIYSYCKHLATKFDFHDRALFHTLITSLIWDEEEKYWLVSTNWGDSIRARFVVMATGVLNMPKLPNIPGIEKFEGKIFHTARWDYSYTGGTCENPVLDKLVDKKVAIVGTGASAIQAIPNLGKYAKQLYVLQRTPSSVDERPNPPTDSAWAESLKPGWQRERKANFQRAAMEFFQPGEQDLVCDIWTEISRDLAAELQAEGWPELSPQQFAARREVVDYRVMERLRRRVESVVDDPQTAEALKPYYRFLCKRPLSSNEYYAMFNQPNVHLIDVAATKGVERMNAKGFIANGVEQEVDCMIFASGFEVTSDLERRWGIDEVQGRNGQSIYDYWRNGPQTLHGIMTHGFPNQFFLGYIQGGLNATTTEQFGRQGYHIAFVISEALKRGLKVVEPTREAQEAYVRHFQEVEVDSSQFQRECTPSYFTNEGQVKAPWALFRGYGLGWDAFEKLLQEWRDAGTMEGLELTR